jgi:hypothetical protein
VDESDTSNSGDGERKADDASQTRLQQGGEAETTRFGMEDGDNTDIPATGEGSPPDDAETRE